MTEGIDSIILLGLGVTGIYLTSKSWFTLLKHLAKKEYGDAFASFLLVLLIGAPLTSFFFLSLDIPFDVGFQFAALSMAFSGIVYFAGSNPSTQTIIRFILVILGLGSLICLPIYVPLNEENVISLIAVCIFILSTVFLIKLKSKPVLQTPQVQTVIATTPPKPVKPKTRPPSKSQLMQARNKKIKLLEKKAGQLWNNDYAQVKPKKFWKTYEQLLSEMKDLK